MKHRGIVCFSLRKLSPSWAERPPNPSPRKKKVQPKLGGGPPPTQAQVENPYYAGACNAKTQMHKQNVSDTFDTGHFRDIHALKRRMGYVKTTKTPPQKDLNTKRTANEFQVSSSLYPIITPLANPLSISSLPYPSLPLSPPFVV